jgi:hypothetical protein
MGNKYKYLDKEVLNNINHISRDVIKYNRALPQNIIDALPDDKFFPISWCMLHEHIAGKAVEPHMRCMIVVPALSGPEGAAGRQTLILDIEMGLFDLLPEVELPDTPVSDTAITA